MKSKQQFEKNAKKFGVFFFFIDICNTTKKITVITFNSYDNGREK